MTEICRPDMEKPQRLQSLDALRGFDMLFIMGLASLIVALCRLWPGAFTDAVAVSMRHPAWDGLSHHDTIFPLFLFIAGVSFPFSLSKQRSQGASRGRIHAKIIRRGLTLVVLGLVYNGLFQLDFATLRWASVLGRIGLAWMFAAILFLNFGVRTRAAIAAAILVGYGALSYLAGAPDVTGAGPLTFEGNLVGYVDRLWLPGRLLSKTFDPEGLLSTLPAIVTAMLGMFGGEFIRREGISGGRKALWLAAAGAVLLVVGLSFSGVLPINKKLWSSTFVCVVGAYSLLLFALFYYLIDVRGWRRWTLFFRVVGLNSITIYLAQRIVDFRGISNFFLAGAASMCTPEWAAVVNGAGYVAVCWLFLYFLYKKGIFLKV